LRLKAKLKITQLQREVNQKNAQLSATATTPSATNSSTTSPRSSIDINAARSSVSVIDLTTNPDDANTIAELNAKVDSLTQELAEARQQIAAADTVVGLSSESPNTPAGIPEDGSNAAYNVVRENLEREVEELRHSLSVERQEKSAVESQVKALHEKLLSFANSEGNASEQATESVETDDQKPLPSTDKAAILDLQNQVDTLTQLTGKIPDLEIKAAKLKELEENAAAYQQANLAKIQELEQLVETMKESAPTPVQIMPPGETQTQLKAEFESLRTELDKLKSVMAAKDTEITTLRTKIEEASKASAGNDAQKQFSLEEQVSPHMLHVRDGNDSLHSRAVVRSLTSKFKSQTVNVS
jgi:hypothetical protein